MTYDITELMKKSSKRENKQNFRDKWNAISMYTICGLTNSENPLLNKVDCPSCISESYSEELWNLDEAVGIGTRQCQ